MDPNFWPDALRNLGLLIAGGALTAGGAWLNDRRAIKARQEDRTNGQVDARAARDLEATEKLREAVFAVYVNVRDQQKGGSRDRANIDQADMLDLESKAYLLRDPQTREAILGGVQTLRGVGPAIDSGALKGTVIQSQVQVLYSSLLILSATIRGETPPREHVDQLVRIGNAVRDAWSEMIRNDEAKRV